jgi:CheY-like chemotaxis protein
MLELLGYQTVVRTSSIEAYELFQHDPHRFDLVITDMTMPNMTGAQLAGKLLNIRPDIPVILCTGYSEQITEKRAKDIGIRAFVLKPLVMREIAEKIREVLDATSLNN